MDRIKRLSNEVLNEYSERFGTDFSTNKQALNEISIIRSKGLKNEIAGYITKILQRQAKFEERKQMIIDNEKKSQENKKTRSKKSEVEEITQEPKVEEITQEPKVEEITQEPKVEEIIQEPKVEEITQEPPAEQSIAEEILDESKQ